MPSSCKDCSFPFSVFQGLANPGFAASLTPAEQDLLFDAASANPQVLTETEMAETEGEFFGAGAMIGVAVYAVTTPPNEWRSDEIVKAAVVGELVSMVGAAATHVFATGSSTAVTWAGGDMLAADLAYESTATAIGYAGTAYTGGQIMQSWGKSQETCGMLTCQEAWKKEYEKQQKEQRVSVQKAAADLAKRLDEERIAQQRRQEEERIAQQRRDAELARQRREAEIARQQREAELARQARQREMERARAAAAARPAGRRR